MLRLADSHRPRSTSGTARIRASLTSARRSRRGSTSTSERAWKARGPSRASATCTAALGVLAEDARRARPGRGEPPLVLERRARRRRGPVRLRLAVERRPRGAAAGRLRPVEDPPAPAQPRHGLLRAVVGQAEAWGAFPPLVVLDQYRMQEVAFGHAGFLGGNVVVGPVRLAGAALLTPVMARYAAAIPSPSTTTRTANGSTPRPPPGRRKPEGWHRVRVRYDDGLTITANQADEPLRDGDHRLGQYGWIAEGAGVTAWTASATGSWPIMPRPPTASSPTPARPGTGTSRASSGSVPGRSFRGARAATVPRHLRLAGAMKPSPRIIMLRPLREGSGAGVGDPVPAGPRPGRPTFAWRPGTTLGRPARGPRSRTALPDGDYAWTIGLFTPGRRQVELDGVEDGAGRIRLGTFGSAIVGEKLAFIPEPKTLDRRAAIYLEHVNRAGQDHRLRPRADRWQRLDRARGLEWVARTFPRDRPFTLLLAASRFGRPGRDPLRRRPRPVYRTHPRGCLLEAPPKRRKPVPVGCSMIFERVSKRMHESDRRLLCEDKQRRLITAITLWANSLLRIGKPP